MKQLDWMTFMRKACGHPPIDPASPNVAKRARAKAQKAWDEWQAYVMAIVNLAHEPETEGLVLYVNMQFDSSQFGRQTVMCYGPSRTYKTVAECDGKFLYDMPSQRQYPQAYVDCLDKAILADPLPALSEEQVAYQQEGAQ